MTTPDQNLLEAAWEANRSEMEAALALGADLEAYDEGGFAVLHICTGTSAEMLKYALSLGCDPNLKRQDGVSALSQATYQRDAECVRILLEHGAKVQLEDPNTGTALHQAAEAGLEPILQELIKKTPPAALNIFDYVARTPLIAAIGTAQYSCAAMLLHAGADVNAHDTSRSGDTALHHAALQGDRKAVDLLLSYGADPQIPGWMGLFPADLADQEGFSEIAKMLLGLNQGLGTG